MTAAQLSYLAKYGQKLVLTKKDASKKINALDQQKMENKTIFGGGLLLTEKAALEKAALEKAALEKATLEKADAIVWQLSEREKEIIRKLEEGD